MTYLKDKKWFFIGIFIAILAVFFDILSKRLIFHILENNSQGNIAFQIKVTGFFNLVRVWNQGVSFGMFNDIEGGRIILSIQHSDPHPSEVCLH